MPDIMKMGSSPDYLGSWDLEEQPNKEITLTIEKIVDEKVVTNGQSEQCTVIYWKEKDVKKMIINITNKKTLAKLYKTTDTEKLKGKAVTIGIDKVKAFGDVHDALRIRKKIPQAVNVALPKCEKCGQDIAPAYGMNPEQVASYTAEKYGKRLCSACATAEAEGAKA